MILLGAARASMTYTIMSRFTVCFVLTEVMQTSVLAYMVLCTNRPLNGFYCPHGLLKNISGIDQQVCTRHCLLHPGCRVLSYNQRDRFCMLGEIPCNVAQNHTNYMLMVFKPSVSENCSIWKPKSDPLPSRTVDTHLGDHEALCRKKIGTSILIGRGRPYGRGKFAENGVVYLEDDPYVLTVSPFCTLAWTPYTAGSTLPENAVLCGHLNNVIPTYCARIWTEDGRVKFGYYPLGHTLAYHIQKRARESSEMDILIRV